MKHYLGYDETGAIVASVSTDGPPGLFCPHPVFEVSAEVLQQVVGNQGACQFVDGVLSINGVSVGDHSPVPDQVTVSQAKRALVHSGLYEAIETYVLAIEGYPNGVLSRIVWDAPFWHRSSPELTAIALDLGLASAQIDDLFRLAATL